jgi:GNAT superfamily N-acetyltransferase
VAGGILGRRSNDDWIRDITRAFQAKEAATKATHKSNLKHRIDELQTQITVLNLSASQAGKSLSTRRRRQNEASFLSKQLYRLRQEESRRRRNRSFACIVAEDISTNRLIACAALTLARPEALFPPPAPTFTPVRAYCSNVVVLQPHRRQGVATELLATCERIVQWWGYDQLYLHVDLDNNPGIQLYTNLGYKNLTDDNHNNNNSTDNHNTAVIVSIVNAGLEVVGMVIRALLFGKPAKLLYKPLLGTSSNGKRSSSSLVVCCDEENSENNKLGETRMIDRQQPSSLSSIEQSLGERRSSDGVFVWNTNNNIEESENGGESKVEK